MQWRAQPYQNMYQQPAGYFYPQQIQPLQQPNQQQMQPLQPQPYPQQIQQPLQQPPYHQQGQFPPQFYPNQEYGHMQQPYTPAPPQAGMPGGPPGFVNPYPVPRPNQQQPSQFSGILSQFKKTNGQFDFNKMIDTTGQMVSAVNQVGSLVKGFTSIFK
ncbi:MULTISPECIES: YppG family protein [Bacillus]|uniref:YppG family protein n=1 Tax=Bacillus TaxID=1386 RepID=UPI00030980B8|nr:MULTISPECIES: YppG family protein [Bacillus]MEC3656236.1 YppG family protein [Bacillus siamensis]MED0772147.1 YppG family protein [Bacillus siamensis]MED0776631.1 YppG family protein [Bacillus siamensis]MED0780736.1 YppG family protein [Bacillus siamensis]MED0833555.1 YppG family protein [Bacillus siamensis]